MNSEVTTKNSADFPANFYLAHQKKLYLMIASYPTCYRKPSYLTAPNMAANVSKVVIAIVTLPGIESGGKNSDNHATMTNNPLGK